MNNDGYLEVIIASGDYIYALEGKTGLLLWAFKIGHPCLSPALGDINGDGELEVVVGGEIGIKRGISYITNDSVYALNGANGSLLWRYETSDFPYSSPVLGDINGDGRLEVMIGDCDGYIHYLNGEDGALLWKRAIGWNIFSSPALGDINGDGRLEVIFCTADGYIYALDPEKKRSLWVYETKDIVSSSPALGDIDGDGRLEVVVGSRDRYLYALNGEDGSLLWKYWTKYPVYPSPVLWDIDNDKNLEIVISWGVYVYALDLPKAGKRICWQGFAGFDFSRKNAFIDSDKDGLGDYEEKIVGTNPNNPDTDDDGMSDHWEVFYNLNPADPR